LQSLAISKPLINLHDRCNGFTVHSFITAWSNATRGTNGNHQYTQHNSKQHYPNVVTGAMWYFPNTKLYTFLTRLYLQIIWLLDHSATWIQQSTIKYTSNKKTERRHMITGNELYRSRKDYLIFLIIGNV